MLWLEGVLAPFVPSGEVPCRLSQDFLLIEKNENKLKQIFNVLMKGRSLKCVTG